MFFDKQLLKDFQYWSNELNLSQAVEKLLMELGVKDIKVVGSLPKSGPVLIVSNHTGVFDSLILLSRVKRSDFHWIALATYQIFGGKVAERLIPVYRKRQLNHKIYEYPLCLQVNGKLPKNYSRQEIMSKNRQSISRAVELVNQGKMVSIFPTGGAGKKLAGSGWKPGVGWLIKQINNPKTKIVLAYVQGTKMSDLVAYVPLLRRLFFRSRPITISFSRSLLLKRAVNLKADAKTITCSLEKLYNQTYL